MGVKIGSTAGYLYLDAWVMSSILHLATIEYCKRFLGFQDDPGGRQYDQMTQAARSIASNIAEGTSRHQTSTETEMKLLDVARASISELAYDYMIQLVSRGETAWSQNDPNWKALHAVNLDRPAYTSDLMRDVTTHILTQKQKFSQWLDCGNPIITANALLLLCGRLIRMLRRLLESQHEKFKQEGGFTENLTADRLEARATQEVGPKCPKCGAAMIKRVVKKGARQGEQFWGCCRYPDCQQTMPLRP